MIGKTDDLNILESKQPGPNLTARSTPPIVTTSWLVLRGTAEESMHAVLLAQYLPGYSISVPGSIIGAVELFALTYLLCLLFSWLYNNIVV